ncbi:DUF1040 family protein [Klebsiella variicola]|uniref:DUF1040 family protein n=1 Tax=Klebsiella variicola TaxID=244366 RepID=UPI0005CC174E|nr:DUF1040 family protein [Klebsiella variicola]
MQPSFHWINEPAEWRRDTDGLTVVTDKHTDFWRHTWYGFERFSGHLYATEVEGLIYHLKMRDSSKDAVIPGIQKDYEEDFKTALLRARGVIKE